MSTANKKSAADLQLAFDVGHSSIGWAVLKAPDGQSPTLLGCGSVIFPADDCLASERRGFRRQRRHIRATRLRIARLKRLLAHLGVLTQEQLDEPGCAWPWLLAARVLRGGKKLTWAELWDVLRWYAHNRGYDGNKGWSRHDAASAEDTEKEQRANALLADFQKKHGRPGTMAEVFCDVMKIDPLGELKSSMIRVRNLGAAFPREGVEAEVERILRAHLGGVLSGLDEKFIQAVTRDHTALSGPDYRLPSRYGQRLADGSLSPGGLLFGQLVPRFDNRIIARCPITFERVYQAEIANGKDEQMAKHEAEKQAKVPGIDCVEFHRFRWAMQLANVQVATGDARKTRRLSVTERAAVNAEMEKEGSLTPGDFKKAVRAHTGGAKDNLDQLLSHPDSDRALVLDPVRRYVHGNALASLLFPALPERWKKRLMGQLRRGKQITVGELLSECPEIEPHVVSYLDSQNTKKRKKDEPLTREALLKTPLHVQPPNGRAPHTREVMSEVVRFVFATDGHPMEEGGPLFRSEAIRNAQLQRALDEQTNNHLVRHRLKLLERLHGDLIKEYAKGDCALVGRITIEVNRDVKEMSGKTAQEQAKITGQQLAHFKGVAKKLEAAYEGKGVHVGPGLIRKGRIAEDLNWTCPYTGKPYDAVDLLERRVDKDHVIPRSERASDSLDSLVITFAEINKWKGKRTAVRFVEEEQGKPVPGLPHLMIKTLTRFVTDVKALSERGGHDDDLRRRHKRKRLLLLRDYVEKEFTPGDLTKTSQIVRLGAQALQRHYLGLEEQPVITSLPGSVTGAVRKSWNLLGCLAAANPQVLDAEGKVKTKTEIRGITHLHHALDACILAFTSLFLPRDGGAWELLVKRRLNADEQKRAREIFRDMIEITQDGEMRLADIAPQLKKQITKGLTDLRVVQHVPAEWGGLPTKETVWRVFDPADPHRNARRLARWLAEKKIPVPGSNETTVLLICRKRRGAEDADMGGRLLRETKTWRWVYEEVEKSKVLGLGSHGHQKLRKIKGGKLIADNFGLELYPGAPKGEPVFRPIRFFRVWDELAKLPNTAEGKRPVILRRGQLITFGSGKWAGRCWRVLGIEDNGKVRFFQPDFVRCIDQPQNHERVQVGSMLRDGLKVFHRPPLCGIAPKPAEG